MTKTGNGTHLIFDQFHNWFTLSVTMQVNVINFNPDYWNEEKPAELSQRPTTQITIVTCHEDIMTADSKLSDKVGFKWV